jgi:DNA-binding NarL/FixJ family response regulator
MLKNTYLHYLTHFLIIFEIQKIQIMNILFHNPKTIFSESVKETLIKNNINILKEFINPKEFELDKISFLSEINFIVLFDSTDFNQLINNITSNSFPTICFIDDENLAKEILKMNNKNISLLTSKSSIEELTLSIKTITKNKKYISSEITSKIHQYLIDGKKITKEIPKVKSKFSRREKEVIKLAMRGLPSKQIGKILEISPRTVDKHRANSMQKCNARNIVELISHIQTNNIVL